MVNTATYLDLYDLFINHIAGDITIFLFLSFAVIAFFAAKFKFPNVITIAIFAVYALMISIVSQSVLAIVLFVVGIFFAWGISRMISRG